MRAKETTVEKYEGEPQTFNIKIQGRKSLLVRSIYLLESKQWENKALATEKWLRKICLGFLAFSTAYFTLALLVR